VVVPAVVNGVVVVGAVVNGVVVVSAIRNSINTICGLTRVVVSVSTSRSRDGPPSRLEKNCQRLGLVSVSVIYVSCPRPIFGQTVQATLIKRINFGPHGKASLSQPHHWLVLLWCQCINSFLMGMQMAPYAV